MKLLWRVHFFLTICFLNVQAFAKAEKEIRCVATLVTSFKSHAKKDSAEISKLKKYTPLKLTGRKDGAWVESQDFSGRVGWVQSRDLSHKYQCVSVQVDRSSLRSGPGKEYGLDSTVTRGASFLNLGGEDGWTRVQDAEGHVAWVNLDHLWRPTLRLRMSFEQGE